ncbi:double-strand break repair protein MRE11 isoform X2 [Hetaerina americana]|uniref:double-strand break repair protein MRE11 isoform X2 n=1 Tax=Hetaerina americana TaxID=62018 RepID=UPI003A7F4BD8
MEEENIFDILVATDIHLGYAEKDGVRGEDSFVTFEEILEIAKEKNVDMILLGGDLFHDNKPSQRCLLKCISLLRRYCMGDKPVSFKFVSDQSANFKHCDFPNVNYEDPNLNISLPVFTIHGNHDDPSVNWHVSSMHLLSATGLVNYFGWHGNLQKLDITPLLMCKGSTKLALYGFGSIKDERLSRLLEKNKVQVYCHGESPDEWYNIMVLHQNHVIRGTSRNSFIPETLLPHCMDFIIWGHEHECIPVPQLNPAMDFYVLQPGSSVATSLSEGESMEKNVFHLQVKGKEIKVNPIPLKTVRPFVFETISLSDYDSLQPCTGKYNFGRSSLYKEVPLSKKVEDMVKEKIDSMILKSVSLRSGHGKQPTKPLIRLRLEYNHQEQMINPVRIGNFYMEEVANPSDMILQKKEVTRRDKKVKGEKEKLDEDALMQAAEQARELQDQLGEIRVETVIEQYFQGGGKMLNESGERQERELEVLSVRGLLESVTRYVDKQETESVAELIKYQINKTLEHLKEENTPGDEGAVNEELERFKLRRQKDKDKEERELASHLDANKKRKGPTSRGARNGGGNFDLDDPDVNNTTRRGVAGRSRARGRGARGQ